ncbi:MAG TPA: FHA domain-containing protein, partial [Lysobacter sp.]|nr:FHA domain-containing protein [Lysobacter sp.]
IAGRHHGRCFALERECVLGRADDADIPIDDGAIGLREVTLHATANGVRASASTPGAPAWVNGHRLTTALLVPGDQLVIAGQHRFVVEASRPPHAGEPPSERRSAERRGDAAHGERPPRRMPWLILAAVLLAGALSLLLLYGAG